MSPAVRNIRGIGNVKPIPIHIWIPPIFNAIYKIIVTDGTTETDITDLIIEGQYTDGVTSTIGDFEFTFDNSLELYTSKFNLWNEIKIYLDYGSEATNLRFTGKIERVSKSNNNIILTGRSLAARTVGKNVTYSATNKARSEILIEIIEKYFSGIVTTSGIEEDTNTATVDYFDVPFWEVVEDICSRGGYDAYIDFSGNFHYFPGQTVINETECVVHESNLLRTSDFSPDLEQVYNRVKVYGRSVNDIPLIATANDLDLQSQYDVKELKIDNTSLTTFEAVQESAEFELASQKDPPTVGTITSLILPTIQPGEMIRISDPLNGLEPNAYQIQKFTQVFSNDDPPKTQLTVQKERTDIPNILKSRIKFETETTGNPNPNEMDFSKIYDFSNSEGTFTNAERTFISSGSEGYYVLKTTEGNSDGTWTSPVYELPSTIQTLEFRISGDSLAGTPPEGTKIRYSLNGGSSFSTWTSETIEVPTGRNLIIQVILSSSETQVKSVGALYTLQ